MKIIEKHENHLLNINNNEYYTVKTCSKCGSVLDILKSDCKIFEGVDWITHIKCPVCGEYLTIHWEEWKSREK